MAKQFREVSLRAYGSLWSPALHREIIFIQSEGNMKRLFGTYYRFNETSFCSDIRLTYTFAYSCPEHLRMEEHESFLLRTCSSGRDYVRGLPGI
jgi:hypothetical protein